MMEIQKCLRARSQNDQCLYKEEISSDTNLPIVDSSHSQAFNNLLPSLETQYELSKMEITDISDRERPEDIDIINEPRKMKTVLAMMTC